MAEDWGIIHGGICPENILVKDGEKGGIVKIANFGISLVHGNSRDIENVSNNLLYMSPETLVQNVITEKSDIWSLGATIYEACMLEPIFWEEGGKREHIVKNIRSQKPTGFTNHIYTTDL